MSSFVSKSSNTTNLLISFLGVSYIAGIQLHLLSPLRHVASGEFLIADSAYAMVSGQTGVPALLAWAHIIPEFGTINFHYPPAYFYLLAFSFQAMGLSVLSVGLVHAVLRLLAAGVFFLIARKTGHSTSYSVALAAVWATFAHGPTGRPEDLAILFLSTGVLLLLIGKHSSYKLAMAGVCLGLSVLTHPIAVFTAVPLSVVVLWINYGHEPKTSLIKGSILIAILSAVSLSWLLWIVPYWTEFRTIFLGFALPDAAATSYLQSLSEYAQAAVYGAWVRGFYPEHLRQFSFHYSLIPTILLFIYLVIPLLRSQASRLGGLIILLALAAIPVLSARNSYFSYHTSWFSVCLLMLIALIGKIENSQEEHRTNLGKSVVTVLSLVIIMQLVGHAYGQAKQIAGTLIETRACESKPHAATLAGIPPHEKVITNNGYTYYQIRPKNPIFWPAGLEGRTKGGVTYETDYDPSFRWMVLSKPLSEDKNPGRKFKWDSSSYGWFVDNFSLHTISTIDECYQQGRLRRYLKVPDKLYVYKRNPT